MTKRRILVLALISLLGCAKQHLPKDPLPCAYEDLVVALGDDRLSFYQRHKAKLMLLRSEVGALPILIDHVTDSRVHNPQAERPDAATDSGTFVETVGIACETILYSIICDGHRGSYRVEDWKAWWRENGGRTLSEIVRMTSASK